MTTLTTMVEVTIPGGFPTSGMDTFRIRRTHIRQTSQRHSRNRDNDISTPTSGHPVDTFPLEKIHGDIMTQLVQRA
jgi:hypothetical protein